MICWCLDAIARAGRVDRAVIAAPSGYVEEMIGLAPKGLEVEVVEGGETRTDSVAAALGQAETDLVVVHDAARPLVTTELIDTVIERLVESEGVDGVIAATPLTDTVKLVSRGKGRISRTERRDELWAAQTPQAFRSEPLRAAHAAPPRGRVTDDAMLVEHAGGVVLVEPGPPSNLKVTTPDDLHLAELLLSARDG